MIWGIQLWAFNMASMRLSTSSRTALINLQNWKISSSNLECQITNKYSSRIMPQACLTCLMFTSLHRYNLDKGDNHLRKWMTNKKRNLRRRKNQKRKKKRKLKQNSLLNKIKKFKMLPLVSKLIAKVQLEPPQKLMIRDSTLTTRPKLKTNLKLEKPKFQSGLTQLLQTSKSID